MAETKIVADRISQTVEFDFSELAVGDGTAALPSLAFGSDQDTGIYHPGANRLGFTTGGVEHWEITSAGDLSVVNTEHILIADGTLGAPGIAFANQLGVGIYRAGSNNMQFVAGGTSYLQMSGTILQPLVQTGNIDGTASVPSYSFLADGDTGMYRSSTNVLSFTAGGTDRMDVDAFGTFLPTGSVRVGSVTGGTAGTPAFRPGSRNTGMYASIADHVEISSDSTPVADFFYNNINFLTGTGGGNRIAFSITDSINAITIGSGFTVAIQNGTITTPGIKFTSRNTGMYSAVQDVIAFSTDGVEVLELGTAASRQVRALSGSASVPAYSFIGDSDTGIYTASANTINFSTGGVARASLDATSLYLTVPALHPDGSAAAPSISFTSDSTAGIYHPAANTIGIVTAGAERWRFAGSGDFVPIDSARIIFINDGTAGAPSLAFNLDTDTGIYRDTTNSLVIAAGGSKTMVFNNTPQLLSAGNGTTGNPIYSFANRSDTGMYYLAGVAGEVGFSTGGSVGYRMHPAVHAWYIGGVEKINIDSSGRFVPISDNTLSFGTAGLRWSTIFAANGTINTSHSSTKSNIVEIDPATVEIPQGVFYDRDGRRYVGYLNDNLPVEARPIENGKIIETMNYEHSVIGILCAVVKELRNEVKALKVKLGA